MRVVFLPEVRRYMQELVHVLYLNNYFGFVESAHEYVDDLLDDIEANLPYHLHRKSPSYFDSFGVDMSYAVFRKNRHTSWYVFFDEYENHDETVYLVRYISNNHAIARLL